MVGTQTTFTLKEARTCCRGVCGGSSESIILDRTVFYVSIYDHFKGFLSELWGDYAERINWA